MLRSLLLAVVVFGGLPAVFVRPEIGVLMYSWVSYMYPQNLTYGFMRSLPLALIFGVATLLAWLFSNERKTPPINGLTVFMILTGVWITITEPFSVNPEPAYVEWLQDVKVVGFAILTTIIMQDRRRLTLLTYVIVASLGYFAVRGGISTLMHGGHTRLYGPDGSIIAENNALALALLTAIPLIRYIQLQAPHRLIRLGLYGGYLFYFLSVFGSYSRGAFVGLVAMLTYLCMKSRHRIGLGIVLAAVFVGAFYIMPEKYTGRLNTVESYQEDSSAEARITHWLFAINFSKDHPFGGGFKLINLPEFLKYYPSADRAFPVGQTLVAHSIYFEMLQAQGFPGLLLFVSCIWLTFRYGRNVVRRTRDRPDLAWLRDLSSMTQTSLVGFCVGGAFLSLEFMDLLWQLFAIMAVCRVLVDRELAKAPKPAAEPVPAEVSPGVDGGILPRPVGRAGPPHGATIRDGRQFRRVRGRGTT